MIAASFSETFKRNAFNNGYIAIECEELVEHLKASHEGELPLTLHTKQLVTIDFRNSTVTFQDKSFAISALGMTAQELVLADGLEGWIKSKLLQG